MVNCKEVISNAIGYCIKESKGLLNHSDVVERMKKRDLLIHSRFRYSLACSLASFLYGLFEGSLNGVRLYGSTMEYTADLYSDIDIALLVSSKSGEIRSIIKELDNELRKEYFSLLSMPGDSSDYLIDAHLLCEDSETGPSPAYLLHIINNDAIAIPIS